MASLTNPDGGPVTDDAQRMLSAIGSDLRTLEASGLSLSTHGNTADMVEQVLLTDTRTCDVCVDPEGPICPVSGSPHRRHLIRIAHDILQRVGKCVGRFHTRQASVTQRAAGDVKVRVQRRITQNPQLFLLLFYFATFDGQEDEEVASKATIEYAKYLLDVLRQIENYCASGSTLGMDGDSRYGLLLLKSFYRAWQRYVRRAEPYALGTETDQENALRELHQGTTEALYAALKEKARAAEQGNITEYENLEAFVSLLLERVRRLATPEQLSAAEEEVRRCDGVEQLARAAIAADGAARGPEDASVQSPSAPVQVTSPRPHLANPPVQLSDLNTSGSDLEPLPPAAAPATAGPSLPPNWYVDESGRSRPPPGNEQRQKQERFLRSEFRARKAYEAALNVKPAPKSDETKTVEAMAEALYNAELEQLRADLNAQPKPILRQVPKVLHQIERQFILALPAWLQQRVQQEFRDVVDWNIIHGSMTNVVSVVRFLMEKIIAYGAPFREDALRDRTRSACAALESASPDLGTAAVNALRFVLDSITALREDVAQFSLVMISGQLKANAVDYIRGFVTNFLPLPSRWESTTAFLARWGRDERARAWALNPQQKSLSHIPLTTETGRSQRLVRGALLFGTMDLLRSGNRSTANRWEDLPAEAFYFEKSTIFSAANAVQECTLLLLLDGTISSMLSQKRVPPARVMATVRELHSVILAQLQKESRLDDLKQLVSDELSAALQHCEGAAPGGALDGAHFTDVELAAVGLTIDKMTNTMSPLYISFEKKVILSLTSLVAADDNSGDALGLIKNTVLLQAQALRTMLTFNWEVYTPFYDQILSCAPQVS